MSGHDAQRTGRATSIGPTILPRGPQWIFETGAPIKGDLVVSAEGVVYLASDRLYAIKQDGTLHAPPVTLPGDPTGSPAIDDRNGYVYFAFNVNSPEFVVVRYDKQLENPLEVFHGSHTFFGQVGHLILGSDGRLFFMSGRFPATLHAVGSTNWNASLCPGESGNAPAISTDGNVFLMCPGDALYKLESLAGTQLARSPYGRNATEPMIDAQGNISAGFQAFDGIVFFGAFTKWNSALSIISEIGGDFINFTNSRASLMPDGTSTVRIGYSEAGLNAVSSRGLHHWDIFADDRVNFVDVFTTPPSVDANGKIFVGKGSSIQCMSPVDGSTIWSFATSARVTTQPVISTSGLVLIGTSDGKIYAF